MSATKIDICKIDNTNNWIRSKKYNGFICLECVKNGFYGDKIFNELKKIYPGEFKGVTKCHTQKCTISRTPGAT